MLKKQNGITLIALIITVIVMLILVGVTINVALNGGLFTKAEEATTKTKIAQIQESLTIKKAEVLAENDGKAPADYGITINNLNLPTELKTEYGSKLVISKDGKLHYDASVVTNTEEQNLFKSMGIQEYTENNGGTGSSQFYGVGYEAANPDNPEEKATMYILENGIMFTVHNMKENDWLVIHGMELNGNVLSYKNNEIATVSGDYSIITMYDGIEYTKNENKTYQYNPNEFDETYHIYLNAFYIKEDETNVISTFTEGLDENGNENTGDNYILFADMESNGITVSEDGEQITYKGNTYTRLKK